MDTNADAKPTSQQGLINAVAALASDGVTELKLDADDRKAMAGSLLVQLEAHIDGRVTRHPDTFQQQLKIIEHGVRRAATASLLENLEHMIVNGAPVGRDAAGVGAGPAGAKAPLSIVGLSLSDEIRETCSENVLRLTGRPLRSASKQTLSELVRAWGTAALTSGPIEADKAAQALQGFAKSIRSLMAPPVVQEVMAPCGACGANALRLRVVDGASTIKCRDCGTVLPRTKLVAAAAYLQGMTVEELQDRITAEHSAPVVAAPARPQPLTVAELAAYAEEHGHLPPANSANLYERRLAMWARQHSKGATNTLEAAERRKAIQAIQAKYPTKREADRLAKAEEMSEAA